MTTVTKQLKSNKFVLIAVSLLVIAGIGVRLSFTSHIIRYQHQGEMHASESPFSPLINRNNEAPNADTVLQPGKQHTGNFFINLKFPIFFELLKNKINSESPRSFLFLIPFNPANNNTASSRYLQQSLEHDIHFVYFSFYFLNTLVHELQHL